MKQNDNLPTPFDDYEIHGIRRLNAIPGQEEDPEGIVIGDCEQVDDSQAEFWSLFGHIPGQGLDCIGEFTTREHAEEVYARITGRPFCNRQPPDRVGRFAKVVSEYADDDARTNLIDLLADAMHWCRAKSVSFHHALLTAEQHLAAETMKGARP